MSQLYQLPPRELATPPSPQRSESSRSLLIGLVVALLLIALGTGVLVKVGFLQRGPSFQEGEHLTASVGESLTVGAMTVTLTSATVSSNAQDTVPGQNTQAATLSLHFVNQTNTNQSISMKHWQFLDSAGNAYPIIAANSPDRSFSLGSSATLDEQFTVPLGGNSSGPYTLLTDVTTPNGEILGWQFGN